MLLLTEKFFCHRPSDRRQADLLDKPLPRSPAPKSDEKTTIDQSL
jgi:hypothetical protein